MKISQDKLDDILFDLNNKEKTERIIETYDLSLSELDYLSELRDRALNYLNKKTKGIMQISNIDSDSLTSYVDKLNTKRYRRTRIGQSLFGVLYGFGLSAAYISFGATIPETIEQQVLFVCLPGFSTYIGAMAFYEKPEFLELEVTEEDWSKEVGKSQSIDQTSLVSKELPSIEDLLDLDL
jgi:hypothetical protein